MLLSAGPSSGSSRRVLGRRQDPSDDPAEQARLLNFVNLPTNMMMLDGCKKGKPYYAVITVVVVWCRTVKDWEAAIVQRSIIGDLSSPCTEHRLPLRLTATNRAKPGSETALVAGIPRSSHANY